MITIPPSKTDGEQDTGLEPSGYPTGYLNALNSARIPTVNMDSETKSQAQQTADTFKYAIPRVALGAFTELMAAMPGISDEDATSMAKTFTPDSIYKDFLENKEGSQTIGAIGLSLIPIIGTSKLLKAPKMFAAVERLVGKRAATLLLPNQISMLSRTAKFKDEAILLAGKQQRNLSAEAAPVLAKMSKGLITSSMTDSLKIGLATDMGIYAVANESDFFFPEEMSTMELAAFYGVPNLLFSGVAGAMTRYSLKNIKRDVGGIAEKAINKADLPLNNLISVPGNRFTSVSVMSAQRNIKVTEMAQAGSDEILAKNVNSQLKQLDFDIQHQVTLMGKDTPIPGVTKSWDISDRGMNTVRASLNEDFTVLNQAISIDNGLVRSGEQVIETIAAQKTSIDTAVKKLSEEMKSMDKVSINFKNKAAEFDSLINKKNSLDLLTAVKLNPDGSMLLAANAKTTFDDVATGVIRQNSNPAKIQSTINRLNEGDILKTIDKASQDITYSAKIADGNINKTITATDSLKLIYPEGLNYGKLSFKAKTAAQVVLRKAVDNFDVKKALLNPLKPSTEMHHTELDSMLAVADKFGRDSAQASAIFKFTGKGIRNFDELEFASLNSKYKDFVQQMDTLGKQATGVIKLKEFDKLNTEDIIRTLNLPNDGVTGLHPVAQLFSDTYLNRAVSLSDKFSGVEAFRNTVVKGATLKSDVEMFIQPRELQLRGQTFKTFEDSREPVYLMLKSGYENPLNRNTMLANSMQDRIAMVEKMKSAKTDGAPMISELVDIATRDPERYNIARQVDSLVDDSLAHGDKFTTASFGFENQPAIVAIDATRNEMDNAWRSYVASKFKPHEATFNKVLSNDNTGDLLSFNVFVNQQGNGWRGTPNLVPVESGGKLVGYKVLLEDHDINKSLYKKLYSGDVPEELFMPAPLMKKGDAYKELVLSPLAAKTALAVNEISQDILKHVNKLREISGRPPIPTKSLHMPAKNLAGKELIYLINKNTGELSTVKAANTPAQVNKLAQEEIALAKKQGEDLFIATETEIANFNMIKSKAFVDMTDFSSAFVADGKASGKSFGQTIEIGPEVLNRMQESMINQYSTVSKVSSAMIFQPEFRAAEFAAKTSGKQTSQLKKGEDIWSVWMNRAMGNRSGNKNQTIGKFYGAAEDMYDTLIQKAWDTKLSFSPSGQTVAKAESNFQALDAAVPDYNPFRDSVEFLENTMKIKPPHAMRKHMSAFNNVVGLGMLRMFNVGLGLINIGTLPTLIPPVVASLKRLPDESMPAWKQRVSAWSSVIDDDVAIWNPTRAFNSGMHFYFSDEWAKVAPKAAEKGHLWQKAVEELQLYTAPQQGMTEKGIKKAIELSAKFTDKTETLSRTIAYATFYNMGKKNLKLGEDAAMDFAHQLANKTIGDFRPNVRPQVYQGATGMPFSLFTTFAVNYMQRVFGYVEKGQMGAFLNQMGLQTAFFGAKSLPGFNQYIENFTSNYDGSENMVDRLQSSFGTEATDFLLNGSVGSLTGLAFDTKAGIPLPGSNFNAGGSLLDLAPGVSMIKQTYEGISGGLKSLVANGGINGRQLSEIASQTFPVRNMRGWFDILNGQQVDKRGQMIDDNVNNALDIFSRVSGIRTIRNQKVIEEFSRQRSTEMRQKDIRQQMRLALRSSFRSGKLNGDFINTMIAGYLKSGGEPKGFIPFLKEQMLTGLVDKAYLKTLDLAVKESKNKEYMRMLEIISKDGTE